MLHVTGIIANLRRRTPAELRERVNMRLRGCQDQNIAALRVEAAKQMRSSDVRVTASTIAATELLRKHPQWAECLGEGACVQKPTYGLVMHGVPVSSVNMKCQQDTIQRLMAENAEFIPGMKATYVG